jgi:hypothetical protein
LPIWGMHRSSHIMVNVASIYESPEDRPSREAWVMRFTAALRQGGDGAYVGFLGEEGEERIREAYTGSTWERLVAISGASPGWNPQPWSATESAVAAARAAAVRTWFHAVHFVTYSSQ